MIGNDIGLFIKDIPTALRLANKLINNRFATRMPTIAQQKIVPLLGRRQQFRDRITELQAQFNQQVAPLTGNEIAQIMPTADHCDMDILAEALKSIYISQLRPTVTEEGEQFSTCYIAPFDSALPLLEAKKTQPRPLLINQRQQALLQEMITTSLIYETSKPIGIQLFLYLFAGEVDDNDVLIPSGMTDEQLQRQVISYLKIHLEKSHLLPAAVSKALGRLLFNIGCVGTFTYLENDPENLLNNDNFNWILTWFKFASHTLSQASSVFSEQNVNIDYCMALFDKFNEIYGFDANHEIHFARAGRYALYAMTEAMQVLYGHVNFITHFLKRAKSDIDCAFIEQSLAVIKSLIEKIAKLKVVTPVASEMEEIIYKINVHEANLAYLCGRMSDMADILNKINDVKKTNFVHIELLVFIAEFMLKTDLGKAAQFYDQAEARLKAYVNIGAQVNILRLAEIQLKLEVIKVDLVIKRSEAMHIDFVRNTRQPFMEKIKQELPEVKVKLHPQSGVIIYCPLDEIPYGVIKRIQDHKQEHVKILEIFDRTCREKRIYTGLQLLTTSYNKHEIVKIVKHWLALIQQASQQYASKPNSSPQNTVPVQPKAKSKDDVKPSSGRVILIEQPEAPYQKASPKTKEKTHKAPAVVPVAVAPVPAVIRECHAKDFGFMLPGNPLVTPIYCSEAAQKLRRPKMFVTFKGIRGVEESVEKQFAEMLNPYPEGILTVGMVNQAGVKLWRHPDALGESWNLCALRFKRKGAAGWLRAIAEPEMKVTAVNGDGKEEDHYLFSLGKPKHK